MEKKYTTKDVSQEELEAFNKDLQEVISKHGVEMRLIPLFKPNTTGSFNVDSQIYVYKKVELIPKDEGVPSPFIENGENNSDTTEKTAETV